MRCRARVKLPFLMLMTAGLTIALHQLGGAISINWSDPIGWFNGASPEAAIGGALRTVCLILGYWITVSTTLYIAAGRRARRSRFITAVTLPWIRRLVDRTLATALTASIAISPISPAFAEQPPPPPVVFDISTDGIPVPHIRGIHETTDTTRVPEMDEQQTPPARDTEVVPAPAAVLLPAVETAATDYTVERGDSLWLIADRQVRTAAGDAADTSSITAYWRRVIDANQQTLRSGDPNLIFPGEIVLLPTLDVTR